MRVGGFIGFKNLSMVQILNWWESQDFSVEGDRATSPCKSKVFVFSRLGTYRVV
jgi:hypothetical protein